ncbi:copper-exporting P-type ATPase A [Candidatus Phycosocius bacilliformis]|uniref:Copper-exporting P-type ATPase A n=1 Tax=Candidatus Phycosocius bacilliformis TaxID=1445552 RepID=A0A2P2E7M4_9PROT|nr:heavy metal translocating P-type ATPase [Candidatus Phycosocius bacilliformis]GBF57059.1 copper-exporting P-type ATPase A [Candidatus Phycosocius bacilliformis]
MTPSPAEALGCPSGLEPPAPAAPAADPRAFVQTGRTDGLSLELLVRGARCAGCLSKIENGVRSLSGVTEARLNLTTGRLSVAWSDDRIDPRTIVQKVVDLGYQAQPFDPGKALAAQDAEGRHLLICMAVAAFAAMNIMMFSVPIWSAHFNGEMAEGTRTMFHWISAAIALPAAAYAGMPFFKSAWNALKKGRANMDVPISLGVLLASSLSIVETLRGGEHAYFDAVAMLLFFLLIGRYLDHALRQKARQAARDLMALQAVTAARLQPDGGTISVAVADIRPGDRLVIMPGDRIPVDGTIEAGVSEADFSLLTGETAPVALAQGQAVRAGALNLSGRLVLVADARSDDSFLAEIARLVDLGEQSKSVYVRWADKAAKLYVPVVHSAAFLTAVIWLILGAEPRVAILNACAVLIITCPCALGLAVPAVQVVASGRLFARGILLKSGDALERLADIDFIVFDKTGVLTLGQPHLLNPDKITPDDLARAALLARASRHPLARAIARAAGPGPAADAAREVPGCGVEADMNGLRARLGRASWVGVDKAHSDETELYFSVQGQEPIRFSFEDTLRSDAARTIEALTARGFAPIILSGDRAGSVARAADAAGIATWFAELTPFDKAAHLDRLKAEGRRVLMVGDGLNDAPALAKATVSMAPGTAADASQSAADLVFQGENLASLIEAIDVARLAKKRVMENFWFAALYNFIASPIAMLGLVTPFIAAIAMSSSSIIVTLNALRLTAWRQQGG